jgi:hypothetical protein
MNGPVLVACERSGRVRDALRARGVDAVSCDLEPSDAPGPHIQGIADAMAEQWGPLWRSPATAQG